MPGSIGAPELAALLVGGAAAAVARRASTTSSTCARAGSSLGQLALACFAVALGISVDFIDEPVRPGIITLRRLARRRLHGVLDPRDDQQHQLHRRARRAVVGHRAHRRRDAGRHHPDDAGRPAVRRRPVLRPRRRAARVPALEPPPGVDLHRHQRRPVRRATRWRCCRSSAPPRWRSPCWSSACRSSTRSGSSSGGCSHGRSPFTPDRGHIHHRLLDLGLSHRQTVFVIYGLCLGLAVLALLLSGVDQLYAFLGVFLAFGLVLFIPTRGALHRPEELEADAYEPDPDAPVPTKRGLLAPISRRSPGSGAVRCGRGRWAPLRVGASIRCPYYGRGTEVLLGDP